MPAQPLEEPHVLAVVGRLSTHAAPVLPGLLYRLDLPKGLHQLVESVVDRGRHDLSKHRHEEEGKPGPTHKLCGDKMLLLVVAPCHGSAEPKGAARAVRCSDTS